MSFWKGFPSKFKMQANSHNTKSLIFQVSTNRKHFFRVSLLCRASRGLLLLTGQASHKQCYPRWRPLKKDNKKKTAFTKEKNQGKREKKCWLLLYTLIKCIYQFPNKILKFCFSFVESMEWDGCRFHLSFIPRYYF